MDHLDQLMDSLTRSALQNLYQDGQIYPMALLLMSDSKAVFVALQWSTDQEKAATIAAVKGAARLSAQALIYIIETWLTRAPKPGVPPSEDPDREEAVVLVAFTPSSTRAVVVPFRRDEGGTPIPLEPERLDGITIASHWDPWPDRLQPS